MAIESFFEQGLVEGEKSVSGPKSPDAPYTPPSGRMYVRTQGFGHTEPELRFLQRCGVRHKAAQFPYHDGIGWKLDELNEILDLHNSFGFTLDMSAIPIYEKLPSIIYYGKSPDRDRDIDIVCEMIRTASKAGIDSLRYNTCILPIDRTEMEEGRGGYFHTAFRLDKVSNEDQETMTDAGRVTAEQHWERIEYLLERIVPVAEEFKVRIGNSQEDPPTPVGYRGVDKVLNDFDGMKRFIDTKPSPFHGWNFCVGSIAEMCEEPAKDIYPFIEYFGKNKSITARGVIGFWPANSNGDDINIYADENREKIRAIVHSLRQQGKKSSLRKSWALADLLAPIDSGKQDYIGGFAVSTGFGSDKLAKGFEKNKDDYNAIMIKSIADRLAEAFAEHMHERVRKEFWGYASDEDLDNTSIIKGRYQGIRPAPGYPACPDHTEKATLFELLEASTNIGISLTESFAMAPAASAAACPISCLAPGPSAFVKFIPICIFACSLLIFKS